MQSLNLHPGPTKSILVVGPRICIQAHRPRDSALCWSPTQGEGWSQAKPSHSATQAPWLPTLQELRSPIGCNVIDSPHGCCPHCGHGERCQEETLTGRLARDSCHWYNVGNNNRREGAAWAGEPGRASPSGGFGTQSEESRWATVKSVVSSDSSALSPGPGPSKELKAEGTLVEWEIQWRLVTAWGSGKTNPYSGCFRPLPSCESTRQECMCLFLVDSDNLSEDEGREGGGKLG